MAPCRRAWESARAAGGAAIRARRELAQPSATELSNDIAVGASWAAERIAVAYLDASAFAIEAAQGSAAVAAG
jgi:hypothetical protein